jgi:hypothetical protein
VTSTSTARYSSITNTAQPARWSGSVGVVGVDVAAQEWIGGEVGVEGGLELLGQITPGDPPQEVETHGPSRSRLYGPDLGARLPYVGCHPWCRSTLRRQANTVLTHLEQASATF